MTCHVDPAHGRAVRETVLCEHCYREALDRVKASMSRRGAKTVKKVASPPEPTQDEDRKLATVIAGSVTAADGPVVRLHERLKVPRDAALARAVEIAKAEGWIALDNGRGFVPGRLAPRPRTPEEAARIVWQYDAPVPTARIADALGISVGVAGRLLYRARGAAWVTGGRGRGGFARGAVKPPRKP